MIKSNIVVLTVLYDTTLLFQRLTHTTHDGAVFHPQQQQQSLLLLLLETLVDVALVQHLFAGPDVIVLVLSRSSLIRRLVRPPASLPAVPTLSQRAVGW